MIVIMQQRMLMTSSVYYTYTTHSVCIP